MGTLAENAPPGWFARLAQAVLLAAIIGTSIASGRGVTSGVFYWWIYPALGGFIAVAFAFYHFLSRRRTGAKRN